MTLAAGCGGGTQDEASQRPEQTPDVDELRALPYVGGTFAPPGDSTGVIYHDEERTCPGLRLYTVPMLARAELIDERGRILRHWQGPAGDRWQRAELLENGHLLVIGAEGQGWRPAECSARGNSSEPPGSNLRSGDPSGAASGADPPGGPIPDSTRYIMRRDENGRAVWRRRVPAHHDIEQLDDGRLLTLTCRDRETTLNGRTLVVRDEHLTLLDENGTVLETWSILDAALRSPDRFPLQSVTPVESNGMPRMDLFHANSVERMRREHLFTRDPLYGPGNILVCFRHQDRIAILDWNEHTVLWSWGQGQISGPHDAQVLESGHILLFDNGLAHGRSRAVEINPLTGEIVWEYQGRPPESFFTVGRGSAQRLPNGNTLLAESDRGRALEVTADGQIVWEFLCPHHSREGQRAALARIVRYARDRVGPLPEDPTALKPGEAQAPGGQTAELITPAGD
jgi:hypothetical protein